MSTECFEMEITMQSNDAAVEVHKIIMKMVEDEWLDYPQDEEFEIGFKNTEINNTKLVLSSNPMWDQCESGACLDIVEEIANQHPDYSFKLESSFYGNDMSFVEYCNVENKKFYYEFNSDYGDGEPETEIIEKEFNGQTWVG